MQQFSQKTISRALRYVRLLEELLNNKVEFVSSARLAEMAGLSDAQVRKDVSQFGRVGRPRVGYKIIELKKALSDYVLQNTVHVVLFGVGNLGSAVLMYPGFDKEKIQIVAAFDKDLAKIGRTINGVPVLSVSDAEKEVRRFHAEIGINATPVESSQETAEIMVEAGLTGIINFAPVTLSVPPEVFVRNIDFTIEFLSLFCDIQNSRKRKQKSGDGYDR